MTKKFILLICFILFIFSAVKVNAAATLKILSIGGEAVTSQTFTKWIADGPNPKFTGEATPSSKVNLVFGGYVNTVTADVDGLWSFQSAYLESGDISTEVNSGSESIKFTLSFNTATSSATSDGNTVTYPNSLPASGSFETTLLLILGGFVLVGLGLISIKSYIPHPKS